MYFDLVHHLSYRGLFSLMRNPQYFIDTSFIAAEQNVHVFKHAHIVCGSLQTFISQVIPTLAFSHTISPGDCSLFSKGNVKVSLRLARKFLQVNRRKLSQPLCGCSPAKAVPFLFAGLFALRTKAELLFTETALALQRFTLPHPASP